MCYVLVCGRSCSGSSVRVRCLCRTCAVSVLWASEPGNTSPTDSDYGLVEVATPGDVEKLFGTTGFSSTPGSMGSWAGLGSQRVQGRSFSIDNRLSPATTPRSGTDTSGMRKVKSFWNGGGPLDDEEQGDSKSVRTLRAAKSAHGSRQLRSGSGDARIKDLSASMGADDPSGRRGSGDSAKSKQRLKNAASMYVCAKETVVATSLRAGLRCVCGVFGWVQSVCVCVCVCVCGVGVS